ncbi:MAG: hypothetical protein Fur006_08520 [Coleofasciculaceae cyanobacterium]
MWIWYHTELRSIVVDWKAGGAGEAGEAGGEKVSSKRRNFVSDVSFNLSCERKLTPIDSAVSLQAMFRVIVQ